MQHNKSPRKLVQLIIVLAVWFAIILVLQDYKTAIIQKICMMQMTGDGIAYRTLIGITDKILSYFEWSIIIAVVIIFRKDISKFFRGGKE